MKRDTDFCFFHSEKTNTASIEDSHRNEQGSRTSMDFFVGRGKSPPTRLLPICRDVSRHVSTYRQYAATPSLLSRRHVTHPFKQRKQTVRRAGFWVGRLVQTVRRTGTNIRRIGGKASNRRIIEHNQFVLLSFVRFRPSG